MRLIVRPASGGSRCVSVSAMCSGPNRSPLTVFMSACSWEGLGLRKERTAPSRLEEKTQSLCRRVDRCGAAASVLDFVRDSSEHRACWSQACRQLSYCGRERADDMACPGHDDLLREPSRGAERSANRRTRRAFPYGTSSWFFLDALEMMSPGNLVRGHHVWRFDHGRHGLDHERGGPLAGCPGAALARPLWQRDRRSSTPE